MATQTLTELPKILTTGMDFENTLAEMKNIINDNPNWKENWEEFYSSEAGMIFVQLFAWIADNFSTKMNVILNELFLSTANKSDNIIRNLSTIGYRPSLAKNSKVPVSIEFETNITSDDDITLLKSFDSTTDSLNLRTSKFLKISGNDINERTTTYELLPLKNGRPDYLSGITLTSGGNYYTEDSSGDTLCVLQGETKYLEFYTDTTDGFYFDIDSTDMAEDTISVYIKNAEATECIEVSSFSSKEALEASDPVYVIEMISESKIRIRFPKASVLETNAETGYYSVFYRTCSGASGNIPKKFINTRANVVIDEEAVAFSIYNESEGYDGSAKEAIADAAVNAPLMINTSKKAVTTGDYDYLLGSNTNVLESKVYTTNNQPDSFKNYFGRNLNPQEAIGFILFNKNYDDVPVDQYNNFEWFKSYEREWLNEKYQFLSGEKNISSSEVISNKKEVSIELSNDPKRTYKNASIFNFGENFNDAVVNYGLSSDNFKVKVTTDKVDSDFGNIAFTALEKTSADYFKPKDETKREITNSNVNAKFYSVSSFDAEEKDGTTWKTSNVVDLKSARYLIISIDNRSEVVIDMWNYMPSGTTGPTEEQKQALTNQYVYWKNDNPATIPTETPIDWASKESAQYKKGIVEIINDQIIALSVGPLSPNPELTVQLFANDNAFAYAGLKLAKGQTLEDSLVEGTTYSFVSEIGGTKYKFPITPEADITTYEGLQTVFNNIFANPTGVEYLNGSEGWTDITDDMKTFLSKLSISLTPFRDFTTEENNQFKYDWMFCKTGCEENYELTVKVVNVTNLDEDNEDIKDLLTFIGSDNDKVKTFKAKYFGDDGLASLVEDPDNDEYSYFSLTSKITGEDSKLYFVNSEALSNGNFAEEILDVPFYDGVSSVANGVKKMLLISKSGAAIYDNTSLDLSIGYVAFQNNCINNKFFFSTLYAHYCNDEKQYIDLGTVRDSYYSLDGSVGTSDFYKLDGTFTDSDGHVVSYLSDYRLKLTKNTEDTDFFEVIENEYNILKPVCIPLVTTSDSTLTESIKLRFEAESAEDTYLDVTIPAKDLSYETIKNKIVSAIEDLELAGNTNFSEYKKYINSIVYKDFQYINRFYLSELYSNTESYTEGFKHPITFINSGTADSQGQFAAYKNLFGTSITNPELYNNYGNISDYSSYKVYTKSDGTYTRDSSEAETSLGYFFCPKGTGETSPNLVFDYRIDGELADYSITVTEGVENLMIQGSLEETVTSYDYKLNKLNSSTIGDEVIVHLVNSLKGKVKLGTIDEDIIESYMEDKVIFGNEAVYYEPTFIPFDISLTVYYNRTFSSNTVSSKIRNLIEERYNVVNSKIAENVLTSEIIKLAFSVNGVQNVSISYLGKDYTSRTTESASDLVAEFYEKYVLNDYTAGKHGLLINMITFS